MSKYEISAEQLQRDVRSIEARVHDWIFDLNHFRAIMLVRIALQIYLPGLWVLWLLESLVWLAMLSDLKLKMPMRVPMDVGGYDPSDYYKINRSFNYGIFKGTRTHIRYTAAGGILYWGALRTTLSAKMGMEIWSTNSDCRTHAFLSGTTGSGKSESLYGLVYNALCWGSGTIYADGKADISLPFTIWSLARRVGREDDFLHLNLLTGGRDPYVGMVAEEKARQQGRAYFATESFATDNAARSNSLNPFYGGTADFQLQLLASLLPKVDGSGSQWQEKAINLVDAIIRCLRYKHIRGDLTSGISTIRKYMALEELVNLHKEGEAGLLPAAAYSPITLYLRNGVSFNFTLIDQPEKWDQEMRTQHGYLTSQFERTLAMMTESYGFVYNVKHPEIDMSDVLLNNRILVVSIPSMEKSPQEAASLGKLVISCIKLMMAESLGSNYEGTIAEILKTRITASPHPFIIITDELAYYYAQGLAVMYAQARSLGFMMVAAVQDIQGLKRGEAGDETASLIANTKFKYCLALEDTDDTFELIKRSAGEAYFTTLSGYDYNSGFTSTWTASDNSRVEQRSRLQIGDVKRLNAGEGFLIFKDALIEMNAFYIDDKDKQTGLKPRVNRFIEIDPPVSLASVDDFLIQAQPEASSHHINLLISNLPPILLNDPIHQALLDAEVEIEDAVKAIDIEDRERLVTTGLTLQRQKQRLIAAATIALKQAEDLGNENLYYHDLAKAA